MISTLIDDLIKSVKSNELKDVLTGLREVRPALVFGKPHIPDVKRNLDTLTTETLFTPVKVFNADCARAVHSGLYLWNDCMEEAHSLAQATDVPEGSYFHAIIHRREPDYWNSGYWFRKTGDHPVFGLIHDFITDSTELQIPNALKLLKRWDWQVFNSLCEEAVGSGRPDDPVLTNIQLSEIVFLITHSYRHAIAR
jgi:hypothetical protein